TDTRNPGALPAPISNNAVAGLDRNGRTYFYSFNGLGAGKTHHDTSAAAWEFDAGAGTAKRIADVPGTAGRLASIAATVGNRIFLFGGYTVAEDGTEVSTPEVYAFAPETGQYQTRQPMPTPVDDAVAVVYLDRYIYLVSGWHDTGNVSLVQVYDSRENRWFGATDYPGSPVFGHAGGIVGGAMVITDGVKVVAVENGKRRFGISDEAFIGHIDPNDPSVIRWRKLDPHPGEPLYRMAASGAAEHGMVLFAGGSTNPYNFNGIGYNGVPSQPSAIVFGFDIEAASWRAIGTKPVATMDHRGLLKFRGSFCTLGGMTAGQVVTGSVECFAAP
ncbi:MAG: Kelch repeat-containing protein, partial [Sphingomonadales bacterium]